MAVLFIFWYLCVFIRLVPMQIPLPPVDEKKKVTEDVEKDRRYAIDAAIVRTMKSRKTLNHQGVRPARSGTRQRKGNGIMLAKVRHRVM